MKDCKLMRTAFISFHCRYHYQSIAGAFLQAAAKKGLPDITWRTFEFQTSTLVADALRQLLDFNPDVAAFSSYLWSAEKHARLAARLKLLLPHARLILGGPEAWLAAEEPDHRLLSPYDVIIAGEAENEFPLLLGRPINGEAPDRIIRAKPIENLDELPSPYQMGLFRNDAPYLHMETSRGCVNHCTFCTSSRSPTRFYSIGRWRDDLDAVIDRFKTLNRINLLDRSLNEDTDRMAAVIDSLLQKSDSLILHVEMHPDFVDDEQIRYLKSLPENRLHIELGIQSFDRRALANMGRKSDPKHVEKVVKTLAGLDSVSLHVDLMAGLLGQKQTDIRDSVEKLCGLSPDDIQLERLKALPGTPIRENPVGSIAYAPTPPWEVLKTSDFSATQLFESDRLSRLLDRYYNPNYFKRTLRRMASELRSWVILWDLLLEKDDGEKPTSVERRFQILKTIIEECNLSSRVREQRLFDLLLHGRFRSSGRMALDGEYKRRLKAILRAESQKGKGHIERFEQPIDQLPNFNAPGELLFIYQQKQVLILRVDESGAPVQTKLLAKAVKGKMTSAGHG